MWYVYILKCQNDAFYTGMTDNLTRRLDEHISGKGGHYTKYNRPQRIIYHEIFSNQSEAEKREQQLKHWSKAKKLALIQGNQSELIRLSKSRD
jgi:putative endonuclease